MMETAEGMLNLNQELIVIGNIGQIGTKMIARVRSEELSRWFSVSYIKSIQNKKEPILEWDADLPAHLNITEWEDVTEGGIFTALWNLSGRHQKGIEFQLRKIPVSQETIELCERYDLNPYRLMSGNCMAAAADHGYMVCRYFENIGIPCEIIGKVNSGIKREIYHGSERGFLERPKKDELKRIYPAFFIREGLR